LVLAPERVLRGIPGLECDSRALLFARALGARHLLEGLVLRRHPSREWILAGALVDATHAATMLALAVARPRRRAGALASAATACAFAAAGTNVARSAPLSAKP
jgi:hypothetical protein